MIKKLLLLLFPICIFSQQNILLHGIVLSNTNKPIVEAHIYNKTSSKGILTNVDGDFNLNVKLNDVLIITALPYKSQEIHINNKEIKSKYIVILMIEDITNLTEVTVNNRKLVGSLLIDSEKVPNNINAPYKTHIDFKNIDLSQIPDTENGADRGNEANNILPSSGNILGLIGFLATTILPPKPIRQKPNHFTKETPLLIRKEIGDAFFIKELHIPKPVIDDFLEEYCNSQKFINLYEENKIIECIELLIEDNKLKKYCVY